MRLDLEKIQIENFYSYKNIIYDNFKDYNVIIGKNNSGKSNLFKLFNLLKRNSFDNDIQLTDSRNPSVIRQFSVFGKIRGSFGTSRFVSSM